jgi:membrane dipeptidase
MNDMKRIFISMALAIAGITVSAQKKFILADTHNDVLSGYVLDGHPFDSDLSSMAHSDLKRMQEGGVSIQMFSIFCNERYGKGRAFKRALEQIDSLDAVVRRNPDKMMDVRDYKSLKKALKSGKLAAMKGVEGGHMIEDSMEYLDSLYKRGARYLTLTWNNSTSWASSAADEASSKTENPGLNEFGRQVVRRMNELGMMVDISHVGPETVKDVLEITTKPIIASHSSVYSICPHPRNLTDEQLKAIAANGGVVFVNFYSGFLDSSYNRNKAAIQDKYRKQVDSLKQLNKTGYFIDEWLAKEYPQEFEAIRPPLSLLVDHIDHIVKVAGINHVGIGSDFDGIESAPKGLNGVQDYPHLIKALKERGYTNKQIHKITGKNFIRVFKANQKNQESGMVSS